MSTIKSLAKEALKYFVTGKRIDGTEHIHTENEPQWVRNMCREAHGDMLPDDWKYRFVQEALSDFAYHEEENEGYLHDHRLDADIYSRDLLAWVSSNLERPGYCDSVKEEYGTTPDSLMQHIAWGQEQEKNEVLASVLASLEARLDEVEGE